MPDLSRRAALLFGAGSLGATAIAAVTVSPPGGAAVAPSVAKAIPIPLRKVFTRAVGHDITAVSATGSHRLTLVKILDLAPVSIAGDQQSFNLIFQAHGADDPAQGIYELTSSQFPSTSLFLSPVGFRAGPHQLQALVNRST